MWKTLLNVYRSYFINCILVLINPVMQTTLQNVMYIYKYTLFCCVSVFKYYCLLSYRVQKVKKALKEKL